MQISPQIRSSASSYTKEQALIDLAKAENDPKDAVADFKVISDSLRPSDDLKDNTDSFRSLLSTFGNKATSDVQGYYSQVAREREDGETMSGATSTFLQIAKAEGDGAQASTGFTVVDQRLRSGETRADATGQYLRLLSAEGNKNTSAVQTHFDQIHKSLRADESRSTGVDAFLAQISKENSVDEGAGNYALVQSTLKPGESRTTATEQFLRVLSAEGNRATSEAQADWKTIDSKVDDQHPRGELVDSFLRLRASSSDPGAAREMFLLAH